MTRDGWVKRYETRDDFAADTGPVVRETLDTNGQALYDRARARATELLASERIEKLGMGRDIVVEIVGGERAAVIRILRPAATQASATATVRV